MCGHLQSCQIQFLSNCLYQKKIFYKRSFVTNTDKRITNDFMHIWKLEGRGVTYFYQKCYRSTSHREFIPSDYIRRRRHHKNFPLELSRQCWVKAFKASSKDWNWRHNCCIACLYQNHVYYPVTRKFECCFKIVCILEISNKQHI